MVGAPCGQGGAPRGQGGVPAGEKPYFLPRFLEEVMVMLANTWMVMQAGGSPGGGDTPSPLADCQPQKPALSLFVSSVRIPLGFLQR